MIGMRYGGKQNGHEVNYLNGINGDMVIYHRKFTWFEGIQGLPFLAIMIGGGYLLTRIRFPSDWTIAHVIMLIIAIAVYIFFCGAFVLLLTYTSHDFREEYIITRSSFYGIARNRVRPRKDLASTKIVRSSGGAFSFARLELLICFSDGKSEPVYRNEDLEKVQAIQRRIDAYINREGSMD